MWRFFRAGGMGLFGYMLPRILIGAGVPLDVWARELGIWISGASSVITLQNATTALGITFGISMMTAELWLQPLGRIIRRVKKVAPQNTPDYASWNIIQEFELWQAACLWIGLNPIPRNLEESSVQARLTLFKQAIGKRELAPMLTEIEEGMLNAQINLGKSIGGTPSMIKDHMRVTRRALKHYARKIGEKPLFLYIDKLEVETAKQAFYIGDYECICSVSIKNTTDALVKNCAVKLEQLDTPTSPPLPLPSVLRTAAQINGNITRKFSLSPEESVTIPIIFREKIRKDNWHLMDERTQHYLIDSGDIEFIIGVFGDNFSARYLVNLIEGVDSNVGMKLGKVPNDFTLDSCR